MKEPVGEETVDILRCAREMIEDPGHWCKGNAALNQDGLIATWEADDAVQWCAWGALVHASVRAGYETVREDVEEELAEAITDKYDIEPMYMGSYEVIVGFNDADKTDHGMVMSAYDHAIRMSA